MATTNLLKLIGLLLFAHFATAVLSPGTSVLSARASVLRRGYIQVLYASDKSYIGSISSNSETGFFGLTTSNDSALVIQYDLASQAAAPNNLNVTNGQGAIASYPHLGLTFGTNIASPTLAILKTGSSNYCLLTAMQPTPKGSRPVMVDDSSPRSYPGESAVFTVDKSDNILLQWINPDGSSLAIHLIYAPGQNRLTATGDVAAYKEAFGQDRIEVLYHFVEIH
ncbi:hypothetical protein DL96DRAFT_1714930 [Flagelloscypha sp. PMI_526]|nr:hypothetical protein DL96DRAFT_1714930 [Flagelloscypha sp. PMI_526]